MKFFCEIIKDINGYHCNLTVDGKLVEALSDYYPDYKTMKEQIKFFTGITIVNKKSLIFQKHGRKEYAYIDNTQPCENGCVITLKQILAGHKPKWDDTEDTMETSETEETEVYNWSKATTDVFAAFAEMMHCISCGYNAWIEVQKNGEQSYPILIPNPELDNPHNWTSSIATVSQPKTNFLNDTEKDLTENWICAFSCSEEAVEAYVKEGKITEGLIRLATDNVPETHLCNIRKTDATKFRQVYTKDGYDYTKSSFYHLWTPKEGIPYHIPDPSIDKVFVVCYNNEPVNMKQSLEKVSTLAKEMLANDNIQ